MQHAALVFVAGVSCADLAVVGLVFVQTQNSQQDEEGTLWVI